MNGVLASNVLDNTEDIVDCTQTGAEHVQGAGGRPLRQRRPVQQRDHPRLLGDEQRDRRSARRARPSRGPTGRVAPSPRGGYLDLHNFRNRDWKPAQLAAGIEPFRRIYDLRHTFATFAPRAGICTFELSRYMRTADSPGDVGHDRNWIWRPGATTSQSRSGAARSW